MDRIYASRTFLWVISICLTLFSMLFQNFPVVSVIGAEQSSDAQVAELQAKLKAIEAAYQAQILSETEYQNKKAEIESQLQKLMSVTDANVQKKLQALDAAHEAGILSDAEYEIKKAELLNSGSGTLDIGSAPSVNLYADPQGRFQLQPPANWLLRPFPNGNGITLTQGQNSISIMLFSDAPDASALVQSIAQQMLSQWQNSQVLEHDTRRIGEQTVPFVEFIGTNPQGMAAHSQVTSVVANGTAYTLILTAPANEYLNVRPVWESVLMSFRISSPQMTPKKGKTYQHPAGFPFWYPDGWTVTHEEELVQLVPPSPATVGDAAAELYFMAAESIAAEVIQKPDDPQVAEYLDMEVQSFSPLLQRVGNASPVKAAKGQGVLFRWEANAPSGEVVAAQAFVSLFDGHAVFLMAFGVKSQIAKRDADLRDIFSTIGSGQAPITSASTFSVSATPSLVAQTQPNNIGTTEIAANEVGDPSWGFKFVPPQGWKYQKTSEGALLGHDTIAGMILVLPHVAESLQAVRAQMQQGLQEEGVQLLPSGALQPIGQNAVVGEYTGVFNGQSVKAHGIGTFSPYGGGAYIVALTSPESYGTPLSSAADAIAQAMRYFRVEVSDLMQHFAGTWVNSTTSTQTRIVLGPNGEYGENYEASYSGSFKDQYGDQTGAWGNTAQNQQAGRWTVRGSREQGTITITSQDGSQTVINYRVHVEKGQTYWREYWFNGALYGKQ